jgi:hypothetical protein
MNTAKNILTIIVSLRGSTAAFGVLLRFSGCSGVRAALAPSKKDPAALRFAPQRQVTFSSQALSNAAWRQAFIARTPPHPSAPLSLRSGQTLKTSGDRDAAQALAETVPGLGICASLASAVGFFWPEAPQHASACEGCGGGVGEKRGEARFSGLAKEPLRAGACSVDEGASPSSTPEHRKNPGGPPG